MVHSDALPQLQKAIIDLQSVVNKHIKHTKPQMPTDKQEQLIKLNNQLDEAFQKFIGTPLPTPKMKKDE